MLPFYAARSILADLFADLVTEMVYGESSFGAADLRCGMVLEDRERDQGARLGRL
jgi:hypothetical protein